MGATAGAGSDSRAGIGLKIIMKKKLSSPRLERMLMKLGVTKVISQGSVLETGGGAVE